MVLWPARLSNCAVRRALWLYDSMTLWFIELLQFTLQAGNSNNLIINPIPSTKNLTVLSRGNACISYRYRKGKGRSGLFSSQHVQAPVS